MEARARSHVSICVGSICCSLSLPLGVLRRLRSRDPWLHTSRLRSSTLSYRTWPITAPRQSTAAQRAKAEHGICTLDQPAYSPDLNPLDFSLWSAVQQKVLAEAPSGRESVAAFKARLRRTALRLPASLVKKAVENIQARAVAVLNANGGNIQAD